MCSHNSKIYSLLFRNNASGSTKPDPCRTLPLDQPFISDDRKTLLIAKTSIQPYLNTSSLHNERSSEVANRMLMRCVRKTDHEFLDTSGLIGGETLADGLHGANETICPNISRENVTRLSWDLSPGPLIGITNETECQGCPMNALVVSPGGLAICS